ncbi:MAG: PAS domain S-box protein, partial [Chloroflexota bacterium]
MKLSLLARFTLLSVFITLAIAVGLAWGLQQQLEHNLLLQEAESAAEQVDKIITPNLTLSDLSGPLDPLRYAQIDALIRQNVLGGHIVRVKIWSRDGTLLYSDETALVGKRFPLGEHIQEALAGEIGMEISSLQKEENIGERGRYGRLIEVYVPLRPEGSSEVAGAFEIYHDLTVIEPHIDASRRFVWTGVGLGFLILYGSLFTLVRNASRELIQRNAENIRLLDEMRLYKDAFESTADAVAITDLESHILDVNPAFERVTGYSRAEALGQKPSLIKSQHSTLEFYRAMWDRILTQGYWAGEIVNRRKNGEEWDSFLTISTVKDERDQPVAYVGINRDITEMKSLRRERESLLEAEHEQRVLAEALRDTAAALNSTLNVDETLGRILDDLGRVVPHDSANVMLLDAEARTVHTARRRGHTEGILDDAAIAERLYSLAEMPILRRMVETRQPVGLPDVRADPDWVVFSESAWARSYLATPICLKGQVIGFVNLNSATAGYFTPGHAERLLAFADQAGVAIERARLFDNLQHSNVELALAYDATIEGWSRALDLRDEETEGHTQRVTEMTLQLARGMGMSEAELVHIRRGCLLHDIGKMGVPDNILRKPGPLTDEEWVIMRKHPQYAFE